VDARTADAPDESFDEEAIQRRCDLTLEPTAWPAPVLLRELNRLAGGDRCAIQADG